MMAVLILDITTVTYLMSKVKNGSNTMTES